MDVGGYFSLGMKRMGGGEWTSAHCVEKIQEMLSRAIRDQEDLWKILISSASDSELPGESAAGEGQLEAAAAAGNKQQQQPVVSCIQLIPGKILKPLTAKLENSLDWCHLALCRIKELTTQITDHHPHTVTSTPLSQQGGFMIPRYPKLEHELDGAAASLDHNTVRQYPSSKLKLSGHLNSLRIPERTTLDSSSLVLDAADPFCRNPVTYPFRASRRNSTSLVDPSGGLAQTSMSMLASELDPGCTQGQNFGGQIHTVAARMDADDAGPHQLQANASATMDTIAVDNTEQQLTTSSVAPKGLPHSSSSNHLKMMGAAAAAGAAHDHHSFQQNTIHDGAQAGKIRGPNKLQQVHHDRLTTSSKGNLIRVKRERDVAASGTEEAEKVVEVVYQRLRPGIDVRKGIPEDGHKGWKKYGNKSIQNNNFCRGYYKCSAKECNAKKMVQPTDDDPSVFEVTYMGTHTCSPSSHPRKKQHRAQATHVSPLAADAAAEPTQESGKTLDHHRQSPKRTNAPRDIQAGSEVRQQKEKKNSLAAATAEMSLKDEEKKFAGMLMQSDPQKNNVVSSLDLPAAPAAASEARMIAEEKAIDDLHLQATDFSTRSTELAAAASASAQYGTADQLTSSDLDSFAEAPSSDNSSRSSDQDATTTTTRQYDDHQQDSKTFALDHEQQPTEEVEMQAGSDNQTTAAAAVTHDHKDDLHADMQSLEMIMNAAGDLANSLEGFSDIHQQLHHLHDHHDDHHLIHDQLHNVGAQSFLSSFHESMFDSWVDLCMDTTANCTTNFPTLGNTLQCLQLEDHV